MGKDSGIPGGNYKAVQNDDGTWNVLDVEIYAAHSIPIPEGIDEETGELVYKTHEVNREFLNSALAHHQFKRDSEKFLYPLHINHHDYLGGSMTSPTYGAGFFMPTKVRDTVLDGKNTPTMFANLLRIPNTIYQEKVKTNQLPYRSTEILDINEPVISSLALMETDVPRFAFPMLTIGEEVPNSKAPKAKASRKAPGRLPAEMRLAVACSKSFEANQEGDKTMPDEEKKDQKDEVMSELLEAVKSMNSSISKLSSNMGAVMSKLEVSQDSEEDEDGKEKETSQEGDEKKKDEKDEKEASSKAAGDEVEGDENAKLRGEVDGLKAKISKMESDQVEKEERRKILNSLAGHNLADSTLKKIREMPVSEARSYAKGIIEHAPAIPPKRLPSQVADGSVGEDSFPAEVMEYRKDPKKFQYACAAFDQYDEAVANGLTGGVDLKAWIASQVKYGRKEASDDEK